MAPDKTVFNAIPAAFCPAALEGETVLSAVKYTACPLVMLAPAVYSATREPASAMSPTARSVRPE
jgi:hypothetical protein